MRSYIFVNYYLAGLYFGAIDSVQKYFDEIICEAILLSRTQHFFKIHPNSIRITPTYIVFQGVGQLPHVAI